MRAHYLQHVAFEGLGSIEPWLRKAGYQITATRFYDAGILPEISEIDLLVVMGGPMSVNDEKDYPWIIEEKKFIERAIEAGKPVLGICLGAQLIASVMGAEVFPNPVKEIGWFPIEAVNTAGTTAFQFPESIQVFHWHGETFNLPRGAIQTAKSKGCENQAFQIGSNIIGLQFHLETTPECAQAIVKNCEDEIVAGEYIQSASAILSAPSEHYSSINRLMAEILEHLRRG